MTHENRAEPSTQDGWLPVLSGLSLAAVKNADLAPFQDTLTARIVRPTSTIAGSDGS